MDTVFAQATASGRAGVAVIRLSGPDAHEIATVLCGDLPKPRQSSIRRIVDHDGSILDQALILCFSAPNSFTGEDVVEFHLHGSIAVVRAVLRRLGDFSNARLAEPGEFSRRALENGQLDLAQIEGLGDLIEAETEAQRKQALQGLAGKLGERVGLWRVNLIRAAALLEATIDFVDEDVPVDVSPEVVLLVRDVLNSIRLEIDGYQMAERIRAGFEVAIVGAPNVGKSTLLNALAGRDAAITSEVAGTTRDVIEVRMDLGGLPVTILDTAGIRVSVDPVESMGIERAISRARAADLRVFLTEDESVLVTDVMPDDIIVLPKADTLPEGSKTCVSGLTGQGVPELLQQMEAVLKERSQSAGLATHERQRVCLVRAADALDRGSRLLSQGPEKYDIVAEEFRQVTRALESLIGRVDVEDFLDEIFANFCVGK